MKILFLIFVLFSICSCGPNITGDFKDVIVKDKFLSGRYGDDYNIVLQYQDQVIVYQPWHIKDYVAVDKGDKVEVIEENGRIITLIKE